MQRRAALKERVVGLATADDRVVAGALVGSLADGGGDEWSDLDLTFAVADGVAPDAVLAGWTRALTDAVHLTDLRRGDTVYRILLFPGPLQLDLSMTPAAAFRAAGPRFQLLFGAVAEAAPAARPDAPPALTIPTPAVPADVLGWAVVYALHARACVERGRLFQAEHYIGAVRDHALALACLRLGRAAVLARGYDDLPADVLARFAGTHVGGLEPDRLRSALAASVAALVREAEAAGVPQAAVIRERLAPTPVITGWRPGPRC